MEQAQRVAEHEVDDGERVGLALSSSVPCSVALLASTYQSQYSLQKKR